MNSRGNVVVELALTLPLLLIMLLGIVEFGNLYFQQLEVAQAAMSGARAGITQPTAAEAVATAVTVTCGALPAMMQAEIGDCGGGGEADITAAMVAGPPQMLQVDIDYPYAPLVGDALFGLATLNLDGVTLSGLAVLAYAPL